MFEPHCSGWPIRAMFAASLMCGALSGCSSANHDTAPSPVTSVPASPAPSPTGNIQGTVRHETVPCIVACGPQTNPGTIPAAATVTVVTATGDGSSTIADATGAYTLQLPS